MALKAMSLNDVCARWAFATNQPLALAKRTLRTFDRLRRECLDHVVVFGERHLRQVLHSYLDYYNSARMHLALRKDAPISRAKQFVGAIRATPRLGGLHHQYARI